MKKAMYARLIHCSSSKESYLHYYCSDGADKPGPRLPVEVIAELRTIYSRLSEDALLTRCFDVKTQNQIMNL